MPFKIATFSTDIGVDLTNPIAKLKTMTINGENQTINGTFNIYANDAAEAANKIAGRVNIYVGPTARELVPAVIDGAGNITSPAVVIPSYHHLTRDNPSTAALFAAVVQAAEAIAKLYPELGAATQLPIS